MEYSKLVKNLVSVLKLDKEAMIRVSEDKEATKWGALAFSIPAVVNLTLASFTFPSGFGVIFSRFMLWPMLIPVISVVLSVFLMSFVAVKWFGGKGNHIGFFRVAAYGSSVLWVSIVPFVLGLLGILDPIGLYNLIWLLGAIWILVVCYQMLLMHHKLNDKDALIVVVIGVFGNLLFKNILGGVLVGNSYRLWY